MVKPSGQIDVGILKADLNFESRVDITNFLYKGQSSISKKFLFLGQFRAQ